MLATRIPERVGRIRGFGNSIVPQVGEVFVRSFMEGLDEFLAGTDHSAR